MPLDIRQETICLDLTVRKPGLRRKVRSEAVVEDATVDPGAVHVSKEILDATELKAVGALDSQFKAWITARKLDQSILRPGMHLLPLALVTDIEDRIAAYQVERADLVEQFIARYPAMQAAAEQRLGNLYDPGDYPPGESLRAGFSVSHHWSDVNVPGALARADKAAYEEHLRLAQIEWTAATDEIRDALRASFAGLVQHMTDRLAFDPESGRPRVFRDSMVDQVEEFLATFEARNLTRDGELLALVSQAREIMHGVTPDNLRQVDDTRNAVRAAFEAIQTQMDGMIVTAPARRIRMEPEAPISIQGPTPEAMADLADREEAARQVMREAGFTPPAPLAAAPVQVPAPAPDEDLVAW